MAAIPLKLDNAREHALVAAGWLLPLLIFAIPVSTSAAEILYWPWLICAVVGAGPARLRDALKHPSAGISLVLIALALAGLTWTIAPWKDAIKQFGVLFQFIVLPVLFAQMRVQPDIRRPVIAALLVAALIWILSAVVLIWPGLTPNATDRGVPFKNYSTQSTLFTLLAFGLAHWSLLSWREGLRRRAAVSLAGAALLIGNVVFVTSSRTTLIALVPLLILFFVQLSGWRGFVIGGVAAIVAAAAVWFASPYVREKMTSIPHQIDLALDSGEVTSAGLRLVYWKKAIKFIEERPLLGHGTGSVPELYRRAAYGTGLTADTPGDPHNQVFAFAIPFGILGVVVLVLLFASHILLFWGTGFVRFMGQNVVLLFMVSGLFNSHLMTFTESKIYLFSVGILGGLLLSGITGSKNQGATKIDCKTDTGNVTPDFAPAARI